MVPNVDLQTKVESLGTTEHVASLYANNLKLPRKPILKGFLNDSRVAQCFQLPATEVVPLKL